MGSFQTPSCSSTDYRLVTWRGGSSEVMLFPRGHIQEFTIFLNQGDHPLVLIVGGTRRDLLSFSE
jgi:hypothetical protein